MATLPGLDLKWRAFRELVGVPTPESEITFQLFGQGLGPRQTDAEPSALDEEETARFLTALRSLQRHHSGVATVSRALSLVTA